ncbi:MAG TPA: TadE/TadG family type IV pilus assembly protein [Caulobacteraceae bacterium]
MAFTLRRDRRGASAVEFALIAPLMIFCYLGVSILCGATLAGRKANHAASAMGDLVAQDTTIAPPDQTDICSVANVIMAPYDTSATSMQMRITSVVEDANGSATVAWSHNCQGMTQLVKNSPYSGPATSLLAPNQSIIIAEVHYTYTSPLQHLNISWLPGTHPFVNTFYLQPRQSSQVSCPTCT